MAGALTANTVDTRSSPNAIGAVYNVIADVAMLSPVDGANNVLLTGVVIVTQGDEAVVTFQWVRAGIGATVGDDSLGDAVGDPFIVTLLDDDLDDGPVIVQAIDRGPAPTSGYALIAQTDGGNTGNVSLAYADAVLYD